MRNAFITYFLFLFLLLNCLVSAAQDNHAIDSLKSLIAATKSDTTKVNALVNLSMQYQGNSPDNAFLYGNQALQLAESVNFKPGIGNAHNNLGDLYWYKGDYAPSSDHYIKAQHVFEELHNKPGIANCDRNIGWIYFTQNDFVRALDYYEKSLALNIELNREMAIGKNYNDIGIVHIHLKKYDKAVEYLQKSIMIQEKLNNMEGLVANYGNLSVAYDDMGRDDLATACIEKSAAIAEKLGDKQHLAVTYGNLGSFYGKAGKYDKGIAMISKGLGYAKELDFKEAIKDAYLNFAALYARKKDFQKAYAYADSVSAMKDSIYNQNNSRQINEMTAKYESEKKELMINSLEKDNALSDEKLAREKNFKIYLIIFCLMIAVFAFVLLKGNVQKKKANEALSHAYKEIEVKNKDITDSINYSKRIQDASLPPKELKYKLFPDAFVFFKPKDIVSGDFYWYTEKNGKRLIAACDCTGHGVPGALMSMIGNNILHQIVNERGITSPDEILNQLHAEVRKALKQDEHPESRDGMDVSLLVFNSETEVEFSGAQRPLWIIRNNIVEEIKGNKFSIGGFQAEENRVFSKMKLSLSKSDSLYLFSDGYVDQFGGEHGKKFMTKNFKQLLLNISDEPMARQELVIDQTIERWRNAREQVDDILVIGIKI